MDVICARLHVCRKYLCAGERQRRALTLCLVDRLARTCSAGLLSLAASSVSSVAVASSRAAASASASFQKQSNTCTTIATLDLVLMQL